MTNGSGYLIFGAIIFVGFALHRIADAVHEVSESI